MRDQTLKAAFAACALAQLASALPSQLYARQSIDFDLVDSTPDPTVKPDNTTNLNSVAAIASVIAEVKANPLPQNKRSLQARDIVVSTYLDTPTILRSEMPLSTHHWIATRR